MKSLILGSLLLAASVYAACPNGMAYDSIFNKCYKLFTYPIPFVTAEQQCRKLGAHLEAIQSSFENTYIANLAMASTSQNFWIGANRLNSKNWMWTTNTSMTYTNWAIGQPSNNGSSTACGFVRASDSRWQSGDCSMSLPSMCAIDLNDSTSCPGNAVCSSGYTLFPGNCKCYKYFPTSKLTPNASASCARDGGMLAKVDSSDLNQFLVNLPRVCNGASCPLKSDKDICATIGLYCTKDRNTCQWADGSYLGNYSNFDYNGHPWWQASQYCLGVANSMQFSYEQGQWVTIVSVYFDGASSFICQKDSTRASI